jgi:hypothetical protein
MSVPAYLSSSFRFKETSTKITDVNDIITLFRDEVVNQNSPAWADMGGNLFQSPADASGRWFDVLLTRIAAANLEMRIRDNTGTGVLVGRMQLNASGNMIRVFSGQCHFHIETVGNGSGSTDPEFVEGGLLDLSPDSQAAHLTYAWGYSYRMNNDSTWTYYGLRTVALATYSTGQWIMLIGGYGRSGQMKTPSGGYLFTHVGICRDASGYVGRQYQAMLCDKSLAFGSEFVVPLDTGTYGTFKVVGIAEMSACRKAMRIA